MRIGPHIASLASLAALASVVALAGCGGSKNAGAGADAASPAVGSPGAAPAAPATTSAPGAAPPAGAAPAEAENPIPKGVDPAKPVATVNGVPITADNAYSVYAMNKSMLTQRGRTIGAEDDQRLRAQTLQGLIADELLYQGATTAGVKVQPADVDARIKELKTRAGSEENYKKMVESSGMTDGQVRSTIERQLTTESFEKTVASSKGVTEDLAKQFYDQHKDVFKVPEQAHVLFILLNATDKDPDSVRADAKARAEEVQKKAAGGGDFGALAKQYSQDATAAKGGDIGFFPRGVMFPKFEEMAFTLAPGTVSPVFETPKGFNVIKVVERRAAAVRPFEEVKNTLMLDMGREVGRKLINDKLNELAAKAKIEILDPAFKMPPPPASASATGGAGAAAPAGAAAKKP